jgi:hypothetical protein
MAIRENPELLQENPKLLQQLRFNDLLPQPAVHLERFIWMGPTGMITAMHADVVPMNLLAHVVGKKEVWLYPPEQAKYFYITSRLHIDQALYGHEDLDIENPDLQR